MAKHVAAGAAAELEACDQSIKDAKAEVHWKETCADKEEAEAIEASRRINAPDYRGATTTYVAAEAGHCDVLRLLIAAKADLDIPTDEIRGGVPPICVAARYGRDEGCMALCAAKVSANQSMNDGTTPLMLASMMGHVSTMLVLLDAKGDVDIRAKDGRTCISLAVMKGHGPIVDVLLEQNCQKTMQEWKTLGKLANMHGHFAVEKVILKKVERVRGPGRWLDATNENTVKQVSVKPFLPWPSPHSMPLRKPPYGDVFVAVTPQKTPLPKVGEFGYPSLEMDYFGNAQEAEKAVDVSMYTEYADADTKRHRQNLKSQAAYNKRVDIREPDDYPLVRRGVDGLKRYEYKLGTLPCEVYNNDAKGRSYLR